MKGTTIATIGLIIKGFIAVSCVCGVVWLAYNGKNGWGWLIFLALIVGPYGVEVKSKD